MHTARHGVGAPVCLLADGLRGLVWHQVHPSRPLTSTACRLCSSHGSPGGDGRGSAGGSAAAEAAATPVGASAGASEPDGRAASSSSSSSSSGGFLRYAAEEAARRRSAWLEGLARREALRAEQQAEWERLRRGWAEAAAAGAASATSGGDGGNGGGPSRAASPADGRYTWWWESPAGGRPATAAHAAAWAAAQQQAGASAPSSNAAPRDTLGHYAALGLRTPSQRRCGAAELAAAFRRAAFSTHPDAQPGGRGGGEAAAAFARARAAYDALRDPAARARYDAG